MSCKTASGIYTEDSQCPHHKKTDAATPHETIGNIQAMRGVAAILIFYHHFCPSGTIADSFGDFGVAFFMMLSGYVLQLSFSAKSSGITPGIGKFFISRMCRIYPLYLLTWIAAIQIFPYLGSKTGIISGFFMLQSWVPEMSVYFACNSPGWFVSDLAFAYLLFIPALRLARRKLRRNICIAAYFSFYFIVVMTVPDRLVRGIIYINPLMQFSVFLIGMLLCHITSAIGKRKIRLNFATSTAAEIASVALAVVCMIGYKYIPERFSFGSYWWLCAAILIFTFVLTEQKQGFISRLFHSKAMLALGTLSYAIYLIQAPAIFIWSKIAERLSLPSGSLLVQSLVLLAVMIAISFFLNKFFEKPLTRFLKSHL